MNDNGSGQAGDRWEKLRLLEELTREELLPELADSLITLPQGLQMVHHPLVVEIAVVPGALNRKLRDRQERLTRETDPETILWLHERPYRLAKLKDLWRKRKSTGEPCRTSSAGSGGTVRGPATRNRTPAGSSGCSARRDSCATSAGIHPSSPCRYGGEDSPAECPGPWTAT